MEKNRVQIDWLNKLYDDIYYSDLEDSEHSLDIISNLISDKEIKSTNKEDKNLVGIVVEVTEELVEFLESEDLNQSAEFISQKIEEIQNGEFDEAFREEYFPDFYDLEKDEEIPYEDLTVDIDINEDEDIPEDVDLDELDEY
ncbi:hypothetical protein [Senegalia massiliensis]|uniref:Uncharacterized protein n=1 Tax=Senegalia massiliensis TaxID=1720316 RepID=A0A845QX08_9CLOT|nr:hypothetical protein [Senegalia massiliensis]NBI05682.1 hypothetical protein [Senegalia massiliensis]